MKFQVEEIKPHTTNTGKTMYFIKTSDGLEMSTFDDLSKYKQGDYLEGEMTISDKLDKNGKPYKNFKLPRRNYGEEIDEIKKALHIVKEEIRKLKGDDSPTNEIADIEIPF